MSTWFPSMSHISRLYIYIHRVGNNLKLHAIANYRHARESRGESSRGNRSYMHCAIWLLLPWNGDTLHGSLLILASRKSLFHDEEIDRAWRSYGAKTKIKLLLVSWITGVCVKSCLLHYSKYIMHVSRMRSVHISLALYDTSLSDVSIKHLSLFAKSLLTFSNFFLN